MNICILCEDSKLEEVRNTAKNIFTNTVLNIGVSESGDLPATHWFCSMIVNEDMYQKLVSIKNYTEMEISNPNTFLSKWNLKIILSK